MNLVSLFTFVVVSYGALSIVAAVGGMVEEGTQGSLFLFVIASLALIAAPWAPNTGYWLLAGLVGLHMAAVWQGITQDDFHWQHHAVRAIVSFAILGIFVRSR
jgi:hypothetical protein